jgi:predicted TIM-barrel fold metal-dependent hydrolase
MYAGTAVFGAAHALRCAVDFYRADHVLFGSDSPFDPGKGPGYIRSTIKNIQEIGLSLADQNAVFHGNATRLLGLSS